MFPESDVADSEEVQQSYKDFKNPKMFLLEAQRVDKTYLIHFDGATD